VEETCRIDEDLMPELFRRGLLALSGTETNPLERA
jgi:hypothetical protein